MGIWKDPTSLWWESLMTPQIVRCSAIWATNAIHIQMQSLPSTLLSHLKTHMQLSVTTFAPASSIFSRRTFVGCPIPLSFGSSTCSRVSPCTDHVPTSYTLLVGPSLDILCSSISIGIFLSYITPNGTLFYAAFRSSSCSLARSRISLSQLQFSASRHSNILIFNFFL